MVKLYVYALSLAHVCEFCWLLWLTGSFWPQLRRVVIKAVDEATFAAIHVTLYLKHQKM